MLEPIENVEVVIPEEEYSDEDYASVEEDIDWSSL